MSSIDNGILPTEIRHTKSCTCQDDFFISRLDMGRLDEWLGHFFGIVPESFALGVKSALTAPRER